MPHRSYPASARRRSAIRRALFGGFFFCALAVSCPAELVEAPTFVSPSVSYDVIQGKEGLLLAVRAAGFEGAEGEIEVTAGAACGAAAITRVERAPVAGDGKSAADFTLLFPAEELFPKGASEDWTKLRLAFSVAWKSGNSTVPRMIRTFRQVRFLSQSGSLSPNTEHWLPLDLAGWAQEKQDRSHEISLLVPQALDGKITVVIEGTDGKRIRNLVSALPVEKGEVRLVWDGLDEEGNLAPPGDYRWRAISHPGVKPRHVMSFVDGPGSNHGTLHDAAWNGTSLFFASPVAEGGHEIIELSPEGGFLRGLNPPHGHGLKDVGIAATSTHLYLVHDGTFWGQNTDTSKPDWKAVNTVSLCRINLERWSVEEFPEAVRFAPLLTYETGPGSEGKRDEKVESLAGVAFVGGKLYVADAVNQKVLVIHPDTGKVEKTFPLRKPVALAAFGENLFALADQKLLRINPKTGASQTLDVMKGAPSGLTVDEKGNFYIADHEGQVVHVHKQQGKRVKTIGHPGGIAPGPYDPLAFQNPTGLAVANGRLWITERGRWQPKRLSAVDVESGEVVFESFGPTNYGAQGAGFDYADERKWFGQGVAFDLDFEKGTAKPLSILGGQEGRRHTYYRLDGRTFVLTSGKITWIQELLPEGTLKPLAFVSSAHQFAYAFEWWPPKEFIEAFTAAYPTVNVSEDQRNGSWRFTPDHGYGMVWVDRNGDGALQAAEMEFATGAESMAGAGWSHDLRDLTIKVPAKIRGKNSVVTLKPEGWLPGGAPNYPSLASAVESAVPADFPGPSGVESAVDRFGNLILSSVPDMTSIAPDGSRLWSYKNHHSNVHGSHDAPLPSVGELQGVLFFSGMAPLDEKSDVFLLNGNHGQAFLMTSDGLYLDAVFPDVRMMTNPQAGGLYVLGGECFGGVFGKSERDGNFYFQGGGISYRVYRLEGLNQMSRSFGTFMVTKEQALLAERRVKARVSAAAEPKFAGISRIDAGRIRIDGDSGDWKELAETAKWDKNGEFPVEVKAAEDGENLLLCYQVRDESPWVNQGKDWQSLFKTGDGIDLQISTNAKADPARRGPVEGDLRLFVAPSAAGDQVVLYRHRVPDADGKESVVFQSPWRSEKVDVVRNLSSVAQCAVSRQGGSYTVEVSVPLRELSLAAAGAEYEELRGDFGVIYGDGEGTVNVLRNYWSNQSTNLVNDVPGEIMLSPDSWGGIRLNRASNP